MKKNLKIYGVCVFISTIFLLICSKNSPLYIMNDWVDANAFFTVGKSMMRGLIPYRDLFEQKGPLLYLIYGIGSLISYNSFTGVFILEVISFSIFLYYIEKIAALFMEIKKSILTLPIITFGIVTLKSFSHGGSAEEFTLPLLAISGYYLIKYLKSDSSKMDSKELFINGFMAGMVLLIKYTLLGFHFGFMVIIFLYQLKDKKYKDAFISCLIFLLGMALPVLPWLIYFSLNNALYDFFNVYFIINIKSYPVKASIGAKIIKTFTLLFKNIFKNYILFLGIVVGFIALFMKENIFAKKYSKLALLLCLLTTGIFIYIGGTNFHYYSLPLSIFIIIGISLLLKIYPFKIKWYTYFFVLSILIPLTFKLSSNTLMLKKKNSDYAQIIFSDIIKQNNDKSLLNYGFLDGGFYLEAEVIPKYYYFMKNNIPYKNYPEMMDEQDRYVDEAKVNFIIVKNTISKKRIDKIRKNYHEIKRHTQTNNLNQTTTYILYQKNKS